MRLRSLRHLLLLVSLIITINASADVEVNATNFPDEAFRNWVLQNVSGAEDGVLTDAEIENVTSIDIIVLFERGNITSLQGIEFFTSLDFLCCGFNQLTFLDVSNNKNLTILYCGDNQLTSLDVSNNTKLKTLYCYGNQLTFLDVSNNKNLTTLYCYDNQLTSLDVSKNTSLTSLFCHSNQLTSLDVSKNTALTRLSCYSNQLTSLDVSNNTRLELLWCYSNLLTNLDLSNNTSISKGSVSGQSLSINAVDISSGVAIPVPTDFDFSKVSNLKLAGTSVNGSLTTIDGQKYLVFAQSGTSQSSIDGKTLTYTYNTGNSNSAVSSMDVTISLSYTTNTYSLSIQSGSGGSVTYNGTAVTNTTRSFTINKGTSVTLTISPNSGYRLASLTVNGTNRTSSVSYNQYTINNISANTTVVVSFAENLQSFTAEGINYQMTSVANKTLNVSAGNYSGHVIIPASVSYEGETWSVRNAASGVFNNAAITAITWNPKYALSSNAFGSQTNPNLLLYVQSISYAPSNVQNVIANGKAKKIVLTDAASGNDFDCPESFTAEEISYTHKYTMTSGINECRGWETIALPFTVQKVMHQSKGQMVAFKQWDKNGETKPYWLYKLSVTGFVEADFIEANTPYIISMPNNDVYYTDYNLSGSVTFSAQNATVKSSENLTTSTSNGKTFKPCFTKKAKSSFVYAVNAVNDLISEVGGYKEGSVFIENLRPILPFEAYMTTSSGNAKRAIPIFEKLPTAIREIPLTGFEGEKELRIYATTGNLVLFSETLTLQEALKRLPRGVYIINGKKMAVK